VFLKILLNNFLQFILSIIKLLIINIGNIKKLKYILLINGILLFIIFNNSYPQQFEWVRNYPMQGYATALDYSNNIYVIGSSGNNFHIIKYSTSGNIIWSKDTTISFGGYGVYAATDRNRNLYFTLETGNHNFQLFKIDSLGYIKWSRKYGAGSFNRPRGMVLDTTGNIYITGESQFGAYFYLTIKYNPQGDSLWTARYGTYPSGGASIPHSICVDEQGNTFVTGGSIGPGPPYHYDYATVKYNANGIQQWVARYDGPMNAGDEGYSVKVDKQGYCYVTGFVTQDTSKSVFGTIKYAPNGDSVWTRLFIPQSTGYNEFGQDLIYDSSGNVFVTGHGSDSIYISGVIKTIKYDKYGNTIWMRKDTNGIYANSIVISKNNSVYITGDNGYIGLYSLGYDFNGNKIFGYLYPPIYPNRPYSGFKVLLDKNENLFTFGSSLDSSILIKFTNITRVKNINDCIVDDFKLFQNYPNPFNSKTIIKFELKTKSNITLKFFDISGKQILILYKEEKEAGLYKVLFDGKNLPSGIYFYCLVVKGKIIKANKMILLK